MNAPQRCRRYQGRSIGAHDARAGSVGWTRHPGRPGVPRCIVPAGRMRGTQEQARAADELVGSDEFRMLAVGLVSSPEYWGATVWGRGGSEVSRDRECGAGCWGGDDNSVGARRAGRKKS
eukprot:6214432-Pleurochrysis_carterae.AAC.2